MYDGLEFMHNKKLSEALCFLSDFQGCHKDAVALVSEVVISSFALKLPIITLHYKTTNIEHLLLLMIKSHRYQSKYFLLISECKHSVGQW